MTLLEETKEELTNFKKKPADVKWVGSSDYGWMTWEEFEKVSDFEYVNGFGSAHIAEDLVIVGTDWWLERCEYDGSEWWDFKKLHRKPKEHCPNMKVGGEDVMWEDLKEINQTEVH